ncbi:hydrogenase formation protein HypD [Pontixanthobacter gangjinensis]|uniref:Hydrogenase maturation factor n=1 Tax=Pontixanthobacter gangjinensis TaxID=1028742 RepID=A0A6I4SS21_9SPHN|nr:hydrogenase formation protein HypD [Pontixanthobacter gangjinensis]MXO57302.1 hydrogenase formation protein HypD [Pontixanthobacter gangjinensis]
MRFVDEFRDPDGARSVAEAIAATVTRPWTIMEICGGQTHAIVRYGIDHMLPDTISLLHGPGCPVCVTPAGIIDAACTLASQPEVILCSFGDMLRVPGHEQSLLTARTGGADVRMVYSPLDAVTLARENPTREIVFLAIGFETTAPTSAMAVLHAERDGLTNFSLLSSHVLVPPAMRQLLADPTNKVQGFLAAGHVCAVSGYRDYHAIPQRFGIPIVVTGFEPLDILQGILLCVRQLEENRADVENQYRRAVRHTGNRYAQAAVEQVFKVQGQAWRGIGWIEDSGLALRSRFALFDALNRFTEVHVSPERETACISGEVLRGVCKPDDCPMFGNLCTLEHPLGATMVSSEGACAAYYRYRRVSGAA